jgi:hypothetical protein
LSLYISIINAFGLEYCVIYDEDPLPETMPESWSDEKKREKKKTFKLNSEIETMINPTLGSTYVISPDLESACGISRTQGKRRGKVIAALEYFSKAADADVPEQIRRLVEGAFS